MQERRVFSPRESAELREAIHRLAEAVKREQPAYPRTPVRRELDGIKERRLALHGFPPDPEDPNTGII